MKSHMQRLLAKYVIFAVTVLVSLHTANTRALVILQYHHISDTTPASTSTSPARFAEHLAYLHQEGFKVIDLKTAISAIRERQLPLEKSVLITFDDGSSSLYDTALPLLKKYHYPFVVFINTDAVEQKNAHTLSWPQIMDLKKHGAAIANHSASHTHMVRKQLNESDAAWQTRINDDLATAQALIKKHTGDNYPVFAYPFGEYNNQLKALLKDLGYIAFGQHSGPAGNFDQQALPRFPMGGTYGSRADFKLKLHTQPFETFTYQLVQNDITVNFDPLLAIDQTQPVIAITVSRTTQLKAMNCFLSPGSKAQKTLIDETTAYIQAIDKHPLGRSRFNCTAPASKGHFFWHSIPFIRRHSDGHWVSE